eukprot:9166673-Lingulodinium_polyedra.AAC.1
MEKSPSCSMVWRPGVPTSCHESGKDGGAATCPWRSRRDGSAYSIGRAGGGGVLGCKALPAGLAKSAGFGGLQS